VLFKRKKKRKKKYGISVTLIC